MFDCIGIVDVSHVLDASFEKVPRRGLAKRRLAGESLLTWIIRRVSECQRLDCVIVLVPSCPDVDELVACIPCDVDVFESQRSDALGRLCAAIERYQPESIVRLRVDAPFVDPSLIDRLVEAAAEQPEADYVSYRGPDGRPAAMSRAGLFAEWCRSRALLGALDLCDQPQHRQHGTHCLFSHPEHFQVSLIPTPHALDRDDLHLTYSDESDYLDLEDIVEALGRDHLDSREIIELIDDHPELRERMATKIRH